MHFQDAFPILLSETYDYDPMNKLRLISLCLMAFPFFLSSLKASEIKEIAAVSDRILLVWFDDGSVNYPDDLQVDRLDLDLATMVESYRLSSTGDPNYLNGQTPVELGRKSKGTEFVKNVPWGGSSFDPRGKPWASEHFIYLVLEHPLQQGMSYTLNTADLASNGTDWTFEYHIRTFRSEAVHVNTIGYETSAPKYGYVYQWMGDLHQLDLSAYEGKAFHVYREGESEPVFSGSLAKRKEASNAETSQVGDTPHQNFLGTEVYECDFSELQAGGTYTLVVEGFGASYPFKIGRDALWDAYYTCARSLYYQRSGIRLAPPHTDGDYVRPVNQNTLLTSDDGTDFSGLMLYSDYPYTSWDDGNGGGDSQQAIRDAAIGNPIDVAGFYHDAGDWDGYSTHQRIPILLMSTFEMAPERFADGDLNLPESGNGIPDLVDEAAWLIKFNYRLRKELMAKGYSDGGVGGARVCPDVFNAIDGDDTQSTLPSWKDPRRYVVTQADAFMTYFYAGQAAQLAVILHRLGKDPWNYPVERLDAVDFDQMSYDVVDLEQEAREAFEWASDPANQPESNNNYDEEIGVYKAYAAVNLYRLTNDEAYHQEALAELEKLRNNTSLRQDQRHPVYTYLLAHNASIDKAMQADLLKVSISTARDKGTYAAEVRACRWGGDFSMPMLVGQATTPSMFESIAAYAFTGEKGYADAVHTTADYFLGTNPLHTTWASGLGPRPAEAGFHLDSRYNNDWVLYPGFVPYGPWSMEYGYQPYTWTIDGVSMEGGHGSWNKDWANFSMYPLMELWPGHERWNSNIHAPMSSENTVHQNSVFVAMTYGFVNNRQNENASAPRPIGSLELNQSELVLDLQGRVDTLVATPDIGDATMGMLQWESADERVAHVDAMGRVTGITAGSTLITCSTLDGSVSASCAVSCTWTEVEVDSIDVSPDSLKLVEGQGAQMEVFFYPIEANNPFVDWEIRQDGVVEVNELNMLTALQPGATYVICTSLSGARQDSLFVEVLESRDRLIADFDELIPVTETLSPYLPQVYYPGGAGAVDEDNPQVSLSNPSEKVLRWDRPEGNWKLFGLHLDTLDYPELSAYAQLQFKYFGKGIQSFYLQVKTTDGGQYELTQPVEGRDCWQLFALDLDLDAPLKQFNVFTNPNAGSPALTSFFDDFLLAAEPATWFEGLSLSEELLDLASGDSEQLEAEAEGNPLSWISSAPYIASVDQQGKVTAVAKGTAHISAVPLYGEAAMVEVRVDGGGDQPPSDYEQLVILDFEQYELDWQAGYGAYAWASNQWSKTANPEPDAENSSEQVITWFRDGSNYGGGFGVGFPAVSTEHWERLSFQVYSDQAIGKIKLEAGDANPDPISAAEVDVDIPAQQWTQVLIPLVEFDSLHVEMEKIHFLIALGTQDSMHVWTDNVYLERGGSVAVSSVHLQQASPLQLEPSESLQLQLKVDPADATYPQLVWSVSDASVLTVDQDGLLRALEEGEAKVRAASKLVPDILDEIWVQVKAADPAGLPFDFNSQLKVYPNPASGQLHLVSPLAMERLFLYSTSGSTVRDLELHGKHHILLEHLDTLEGFYLLKIEWADGRVAYRKLQLK